MSNGPDLIIRPDWWLLGIWWAHWPAVTAHPGGQWFAWVRRDACKLGEMPVWHFWHFSRPDPDTPWSGQMEVLPMSAASMFDRANAYQQRHSDGKVFFSMCRIDIHGDGAELVRRIAAGAKLPPWLSVLVIEKAAKPSNVLPGGEQ